MSGTRTQEDERGQKDNAAKVKMKGHTIQMTFPRKPVRLLLFEEVDGGVSRRFAPTTCPDESTREHPIHSRHAPIFWKRRQLEQFPGSRQIAASKQSG